MKKGIFVTLLILNGISLVMGQNRNFNPLRLNGSPFYAHLFSISTRGRLTLISPEGSELAFRAYIIRNHKPLQNELSSTTRVCTAVLLEELAKYTKPGDMLLLEPVKKSYANLRKTLSLNFISGELLSRYGRIDGC